jgi:hypothetical protein
LSLFSETGRDMQGKKHRRSVDARPAVQVGADDRTSGGGDKPLRCPDKRRMNLCLWSRQGGFEMSGKICKRVINSLKPGSDALFLWDSELRGFGFKVTPEGKRVYVVQYRMGGRGFVSRRYTIGPHGLFTPDEARERARKILQNVHDGIDPMLLKRAQQVETIEKLVEAFIENRKHRGRKSVGQIKRVLEKDLKSWRGRAVASITKSDVHQLLDGIIGRGSPVLANRALTHLTTMFGWARSRGYIVQSPAEGIEKPTEEIA